MEGLPSNRHLFAPSKGKSAVFVTEDEVMFEADFGNKSPERPLHSQWQKLHHEPVYDVTIPPQQAPYQEGVHEESTLQLARAVGMGQIEVNEQRKAMQEMERKRQLDEIKQALPNENINVSSQAEMWRKISEEQSRETKQGREREKGARDQHKPPKKEEPIYDLPVDNIPSQEGSPSQGCLRHQHQVPARSQSGHYQQQHGGPGWHPHYGHHQHPQLDTEQQHHSLNQPYPQLQHQIYSQPHPQTQPPHHHPPHPQLRHNMAYDGQHTYLGLEVGSAVQLANNGSRTGVIRWIGNFHGMQYTLAGVELVSYYQCVKGYYVVHMYTGRANGELW